MCSIADFRRSKNTLPKINKYETVFYIYKHITERVVIKRLQEANVPIDTIRGVKEDFKRCLAAGNVLVVYIFNF